MNLFIPASALLIVLALIFFWVSKDQRRAAGLPSGRVISSDTGGWTRLEKPLYDPETGLTGRPDYVIADHGALIPVEVKSGYAPSEPRDGHVFQLAAYCLLIERVQGSRPAYGILHYRNRTFAIDYTPQLENELLALLEQIRAGERRIQVPRSHDDPARCARCGYRSTCDQKL